MEHIKNFSQSLRVSINRHALKKSEWICENFAHPRNDRMKWSFKDHEFQIAIADDEAQEKCIKKCAQVGLSELSIRMSLSFCAMSDYRKMAYILPTAKFSSEFSATRFDPAILSSPYISKAVSKDVDNTGVKKIGTCFLVMKGTSGTTSSISIDLDWLLADEVDRCDLDILGAFASRLQHSDLKLITNFSTPTVPDYGVSKLYTDSSQARYRVKHSTCEQWVAPEFYNDVVIPGFESVSEFRSEDWDHPGVAGAYIKCPHCAGKINWEDFCNPDRRHWVHEFPDKSLKGFHVVPWDVPKYNELPEVLASIRKYKLHSDWVNFRLGLEHQDAESSFIEEVIRRNTQGACEVPPGVFIGADLGKTSWAVVGIATGAGLKIVHAESIEVSDIENNSLGLYLLKLFRKYRGRRVITDAAPDYTVAMYLGSQLYDGQAYGAYYGGAKSNTLDIYTFKDKDKVVQIDRDGHFDDLCKAVNAGGITFTQGVCYETMVNHLLAMKKVNGKWINTGPDHFAHALGYCFAAYSSIEERFKRAEVKVDVGLRKVKLKEV